MKQHILFFDIDGTLLDVPHGISSPTNELKQAIQQLQKNGHLCFIATGRTFAYLNKNILDLNFDGFVTCNGAVVFKDNQIIIDHYFPRNICKEIIDFLEENNNGYTLCTPYKAHALPKYKEIFDVFQQFEVPKENISTEINLGSMNITKIEITAKNNHVRDYILGLKRFEFEVSNHGEYVFEINMPNITKGKSILELLKTLNIPVENSIAFGDGSNDVEMLKTVGHGVAMGNACQEAKEAAKVVCESCVDNGIVRELQRLGLIEKMI